MLVEVTSLAKTKTEIAPVLESKGYDYFWRPSFGDDIPPFYAWFIKRNKDKPFDEVINDSINQTIVRSINTSVTTLFVLLAILIFGGESIKFFVLALIFGVIIGTYSSIFLASPLLCVWNRTKS